MASPVFIANDPVQSVCRINLTRLVCQAARPIRQARTPDEDADFWRNKGNEFFKFGDHAKAKQCYTSSIAALPSAAAFANRALVCTKLKEWTQAETDCSQVCTEFPSARNYRCALPQSWACIHSRSAMLEIHLNLIPYLCRR